MHHRPIEHNHHHRGHLGSSDICLTVAMCFLVFLSDDVLVYCLEFALGHSQGFGRTSRRLHGLWEAEENNDGFGRMVPQIWIGGMWQLPWCWNPGDPMVPWIRMQLTDELLLADFDEDENV